MSLMTVWNYSIFWSEALSQIKEEFIANSKETEYAMWINNIKYVDSKELILVVSVPSSFLKDQIYSRGYVALIENKMKELSGQELHLDFIVNGISPVTSNTHTIQKPIEQKKELSTNPNKETIKIQKNSQLREDYNFDSFVMGDNNSFAYNAARAISANPGRAYNPVLIYGGVGLGKTHLMQAIGNEILDRDPNSKVIFISAENFTNEFVSSLNDKNSAQKFKTKYRSADVLLIDDIHFLQNKDGTQEELFYTYEAMYNSFKQIVFTCDRPVSELKNLTERLRSRFERGLNVDLQPPKYETRRAILEKKIQTQSKQIPSEVIDLIAKNVETNVRDLESCLTKIIAYMDLVESNITLETAQQQLRDAFSSPKQANISIDIIQRVVADYFNISLSDLKGKKRTRNITLPRQLAMYIVRELTEFSTTEVGAEFGGRDHTTVMHSCQKIEETLRSDSTLEATLQILIRNVKDYKK